ncbi:hypothetical protein [Mycolicibacterium fortuitum]|nr:hypothetical protein [Mycolicibacterium fortuitum]
MSENDNTASSDSRLQEMWGLLKAGREVLSKAHALGVELLEEFDIDDWRAPDVVKAVELAVDGRRAADQGQATMFKVVKA